MRVSARPSDSIALALRVGAPIRCAEQVLTEAGIVIPDEQEDEVEKFREFLDQVTPGGLRRLTVTLHRRQWQRFSVLRRVAAVPPW